VPDALSPLVGRHAELARLLEVSSGLQDGHGSLVCILGEAGIGKSRLVVEWRRAADEARPPGVGILWAEARSLSYGSAIPHQMIGAMLRSFIAVSEEAPLEPGTDEALAQALQRSLARALSGKAGEVDETYPFLAHLLGLPLDAGQAARVRYLEGRALIAQYVNACRRLLTGLAMQVPTVILCNDVHWADPSSVDLTAELLALAGQAPLSFVLVSRPDPTAAGWRLITRARSLAGVPSVELHLEPLSGADSAQLVANLLNSATLPESLRELVLARTEGNPLFVEEVLRMLIEQGVLVRAGEGDSPERWQLTREVRGIDIPETLQGVLAARIDRLDEDAKHTLQVASVIGRRFDVPILERVLEQVP
jgi:predicted ATPase